MLTIEAMKVPLFRMYWTIYSAFTSSSWLWTDPTNITININIVNFILQNLILIIILYIIIKSWLSICSNYIYTIDISYSISSFYSITHIPNNHLINSINIYSTFTTYSTTVLILMFSLSYSNPHNYSLNYMSSDSLFL